MGGAEAAAGAEQVIILLHDFEAEGNGLAGGG
jgi:hypothetical protein